ncbi:MAG: DUF2283 domain-containing protein [Aquabacterium sp.]|nr:DUF2283 domain-containing protein [Aquabacterium sp.]
MKTRHFKDTDTFHIELQPGTVAETRGLDENTLVDVGAAGQLLAITTEHAQACAALPAFTYKQIAA